MKISTNILKLFLGFLVFFQAGNLFSNIVIPEQPTQCWEFANPAVRIIAGDIDTDDVDDFTLKISGKPDITITDRIINDTENGQKEILLILSKLPAGVYNYELTADGDQYSGKLEIFALPAKFMTFAKSMLQFTAFYDTKIFLEFDNALKPFDSQRNYRIKLNAEGLGQAESIIGLNTRYIDDLTISPLDKDLNLKLEWMQPYTGKTYEFFSISQPVQAHAPEVNSRLMYTSFTQRGNKTIIKVDNIKVNWKFNSPEDDNLTGSSILNNADPLIVDKIRQLIRSGDKQSKIYKIISAEFGRIPDNLPEIVEEIYKEERGIKKKDNGYDLKIKIANIFVREGEVEISPANYSIFETGPDEYGIDIAIDNSYINDNGKIRADLQIAIEASCVKKDNGVKSAVIKKILPIIVVFNLKPGE